MFKTSTSEERYHICWNVSCIAFPEFMLLKSGCGIGTILKERKVIGLSRLGKGT
jgi:hypothetical protein